MQRRRDDGLGPQDRGSGPRDGGAHPSEPWVVGASTDGGWQRAEHGWMADSGGVKREKEEGGGC